MSRLQAFLQSCHDFVYETDERLASQDSIRIYRWSFSWMLDSTSPKKAFKDIFLPEHLQLESLLAELDDFRTEKTREEYQVRGIPYQKHILFSGPPRDR